MTLSRQCVYWPCQSVFTSSEYTPGICERSEIRGSLLVQSATNCYTTVQEGGVAEYIVSNAESVTLFARFVLRSSSHWADLRSFSGHVWYLATCRSRTRSCRQEFEMCRSQKPRADFVTIKRQAWIIVLHKTAVCLTALITATNTCCTNYLTLPPFSRHPPCCCCLGFWQSYFSVLQSHLSGLQ